MGACSFKYAGKNFRMDCLSSLAGGESTSSAMPCGVAPFRISQRDDIGRLIN
jgi:hypothetical protein